MKAIILAGGLGKRLGLVNIPKPMYEINGRPILEYSILLLKKHGVKNICIAVHYMADKIQDYFGNGKKWNVEIKYSIEKEPLGTSGAVKNAEWFFGKEPFFVVYGDNYTDINLKSMLDFHLSKKTIATVAVFDQERIKNSGIAGGFVELNEDNTLLSFTEAKANKQHGYVNAGVYIFDSEVLDVIPKGVSSDFGKDIFPKLISSGHLLKGYVMKGFVLAIDTQQALNITEEVVNKSDNY